MRAEFEDAGGPEMTDARVAASNALLDWPRVTAKMTIRKTSRFQ